MNAVDVEHDIALKRYSGRIFDDRRYPTVDELEVMPLKDLIRLRPSTHLRGPEKDHYYTLFAKHPRVKPLKIDRLERENFIQGWLDILHTESPKPYSKKLTMCITEHLRADPKVDLHLLNETISRYQKERHDISQTKRRIKRRLSENPIDRKMRIRELQLYAKHNKRQMSRQKYMNRDADAFTEMLNKYGIDIEARAEEIEMKSRFLREYLGGAQLTTFALRNFLKRRNPDETGITAAMQNRSRHNVRLIKKKHNDAKKEYRRLLSKERSRKKEKDAEMQMDTNLLPTLLSLSHWWTLQ